MLNKNSLFGGRSDSVVYEGYIIPQTYRDANYSNDLIGYEEGVAGNISESLRFISRLRMSVVQTEPITFNIRMFNGKPEMDGNVAHVFECEINTDISDTKKGFLIPGTDIVSVADRDSRYYFPGNYYTIFDEIPDTLRVEDKNGNTLETFSLSFPQEKFVSNVKGGLVAFFEKDGVIVNYSTVKCHKRFTDGVKCNVSLRITPLTRGGVNT